jgi:hypothetical protein
MTMTGNEPPADAQRRLAEFELAELGGDPVGRNAAIAAIKKSPGGRRVHRGGDVSSEFVGHCRR